MYQRNSYPKKSSFVYFDRILLRHKKEFYSKRRERERENINFQEKMYITRVISLAISRLENWQSLLDVEKREVEGGGRNYLVDCTEYGGLLGRKCALIRRRLLLSTFRKDGRLTGGRRLDAPPPLLFHVEKSSRLVKIAEGPLFLPFPFFATLWNFSLFSHWIIYIYSSIRLSLDRIISRSLIMNFSPWNYAQQIFSLVS